MIFRKVASFVAVAISCLSYGAQDPDFGKLDDYFKGQLAKNVSPSISVAVAKDGKVVYAKAFGYSDLENDVLATPESVYRIGSITKQFTATMILQLVREGKLTLDERFRTVLPELPKAWDAITVRQLLNHTSGIKAYTGIPGLFSDAALKPIKPAGILRTVEKLPLEFAPGSQWRYNNSGYEVLGMIIEKLDKRQFSESLHARILDPLGMTSTYFTSEKTVVKHRAQGYVPAGKGFEHAPYLNMDWPFAAGSMESCPLDLAKWDAALYGDSILPQASLKQMWTPTVLSDGKKQDYGFGWSLGNLNGVDLVEHGGGIHGFISFIKRAPARGLTVIVLTNSGEGPADKMASDAMAIVDPKLKVEPAKAIADNDPTATSKARATVQSIIDGKLDRTTLTPEFSKVVTPELEHGAQTQLSAMEKITKFELISNEAKGGVTTRTYRATLGSTDITIVIAINGKGLISMLGIRP